MVSLFYERKGNFWRNLLELTQAVVANSHNSDKCSNKRSLGEIRVVPLHFAVRLTYEQLCAVCGKDLTVCPCFSEISRYHLAVYSGVV